MTRLNGKLILVTGGARGLGRAICERCMAEGAQLAFLDVLDQAERTARELDSTGHRVLSYRCDITEPDELRSVAYEIERNWGRLDGLVNNAALATGLAGKTFDQIAEADWDRVFQVNVKGTWQVCKAMVPLLKAAQTASIVNLASDTALWGADLFAHYVASKGAIIAFTRALARELGPFMINVNAVAPGLTPTEATEKAPPRRWRQYEDGQVLKRQPTPQEIAGMVVTLLTPDARFMTGQTLAINGGLTMS